MLLYNLSIFILKIGARLSAPFNQKNKKLILGHQGAIATISKASVFSETDFVIWIHSASLGEFEQAIPIIEEIKATQPNSKILLSFFSPSGYEIRKDYPLADGVTYLPFDTKKNAANFIKCYKPNLAIFIKYEFWYHYMATCRKNNVPIFSVSTILRPNQVFFKYKTSYNKILGFVNHYFVQNLESEKLLQSRGLENITVSGDTRFDRVLSIRDKKKDIAEIKAFCKRPITVVIGSLWMTDLEIMEYIINQNTNINFIIAPHEIDKENIHSISRKLTINPILYSELIKEKTSNSHVLIIDCIGKLTDIYSLADIAYVGGAFGAGLHNILEPATYGLPIIFGPHYDKFQEAKDLTQKEGAFSISLNSEFEYIFNKLKKDSEFRKKAGDISYQYVNSMSGATQKVMSHLTPYFQQ